MAYTESGYELVTISELCSNFGITQLQQQRYGLCNGAVRRITGQEFEEFRRTLRKRAIEEHGYAKRVCLAGAAEEGVLGSAGASVDVDTVALLCSDSSTFCPDTAAVNDTPAVNDTVSLEYLKGVTLISSPMAKTPERGYDDFSVLHSEEEEVRDSSPPLTFGQND